jgi:hypothetical protein
MREGAESVLNFQKSCGQVGGRFLERMPGGTVSRSVCEIVSTREFFSLITMCAQTLEVYRNVRSLLIAKFRDDNSRAAARHSAA